MPPDRSYDYHRHPSGDRSLQPRAHVIAEIRGQRSGTGGFIGTGLVTLKWIDAEAPRPVGLVHPLSGCGDEVAGVPDRDLSEVTVSSDAGQRDQVPETTTPVDPEIFDDGWYGAPVDLVIQDLEEASLIVELEMCTEGVPRDEVVYINLGDGSMILDDCGINQPEVREPIIEG